MEKEYQTVVHLDGINIYLPSGTFEKPTALGGIWKRGKGYDGKNFKHYKGGVSLYINQGGGGTISGNLFNFNGLKGSFDLLYEVLESLGVDPELVRIKEFEFRVTILDKDVNNDVFDFFCERIVKEPYQTVETTYYPYGLKKKRSNISLGCFDLIGGRVYSKGYTAASIGGSGKKIEYRALRCELQLQNKGVNPKSLGQLQSIFLENSNNYIDSIKEKFKTMIREIRFDETPERDEFRNDEDWAKAIACVAVLSKVKNRRIVDRYAKQLKDVEKRRKRESRVVECENIRAKVLECLSDV